jgi:hypothetical protein
LVTVDDGALGRDRGVKAINLWIKEVYGVGGRSSAGIYRDVMVNLTNL